MANLLTLDDVRDRFPATPDGYRPSERFLRKTVRQLGCYVQVGRAIYLTEDHWKQLLIGLQGRPHGTSDTFSRTFKPSVKPVPSSPLLELNELTNKFANRNRLRRFPED